MIKFEKVSLCEDIVLNDDESPRELIRPFKRLHSDVYPYLTAFFVIVELLYANTSYKVLTVRIRGKEIIYESSGAGIEPMPRKSFGIAIGLNDITFPEPGKYTVEILLNGLKLHSTNLVLE